MGLGQYLGPFPLGTFVLVVSLQIDQSTHYQHQQQTVQDLNMCKLGIAGKPVDPCDCVPAILLC